METQQGMTTFIHVPDFLFFEVSFELLHGLVVILLFCYQAQANQAQVPASAFVDYAVVDSPRWSCEMADENISKHRS